MRQTPHLRNKAENNRTLKPQQQNSARTKHQQIKCSKNHCLTKPDRQHNIYGEGKILGDRRKWHCSLVSTMNSSNRALNSEDPEKLWNFFQAKHDTELQQEQGYTGTAENHSHSCIDQPKYFCPFCDFVPNLGITGSQCQIHVAHKCHHIPTPNSAICCLQMINFPEHVLFAIDLRTIKLKLTISPSFNNQMVFLLLCLFKKWDHLLPIMFMGLNQLKAIQMYMIESKQKIYVELWKDDYITSNRQKENKTPRIKIIFTHSE